MSRKPDFLIAASCGGRPDASKAAGLSRDNSLSASRHNLLTSVFWSDSSFRGEPGCRDNLMTS